MDRQHLAPTRLLLLCWVVWTGLGALAVGKAVAGFCTVMGYAPNRGFLIGFGVSWALGALWALAHYLSLRYSLDSHLITKSSGILWRHRRSTPLDKITNIDVRQGPVEQLLRFGQVWIYTPSSGIDTPEERLLGIRDPQAVKEAIVRLAEAGLPATAGEAEKERRDVARLLTEIRDTLARIDAALARQCGKGTDSTPTAPVATAKDP